MINKEYAKRSIENIANIKENLTILDRDMSIAFGNTKEYQ